MGGICIIQAKSVLLPVLLKIALLTKYDICNILKAIDEPGGYMEQKRVLIVDDEPDFIDLAKVRLEASGCSVIVAYSGDEALAKIKSERPSAVLLDIAMPGLNGLGVLKKIRGIDKEVPVYIVTAFSSKERSDIAREIGASGFVVKTDDLPREMGDMLADIGLPAKRDR